MSGIQQWPSLATAGEPADDAVGPFPLARFVETWWSHLGGGDPMTVEAGDCVLPMTREGRVIQIAGDADLTDYHSPLGHDLEGLGAALAALVGEGHRLALDSLPEKSARGLARGLAGAGVEAEAVPDVVAAVLPLDSGQSHLGRLSKRHRHEARRKRRRYEETAGEVVVVTGSDRDAFDRFAELHRSSPGRKGDFMSGNRAAFFADLAVQPGWRIDELRAGERTVAALFGYHEDQVYYLYNSAYDAAFREASPGIVLLVEAIEALRADGVLRVDFLKGDEEYKFRLGARHRQLYRIDVG